MLQWIKDAIVDGWTAEPTYPGHESIEEAITLTKDGFSIQSLDRSEKWAKWGMIKAQQQIAAWGPDGLIIDLPETYSMEALKKGLLICCYCGKEGPTKRISFAGRTCNDCYEKNVDRLEYPGWAN